MASHRANASGLCRGREAFTSDPAARAWFLKHGGATCRSELPRERFRSNPQRTLGRAELQSAWPQPFDPRRPTRSPRFSRLNSSGLFGDIATAQAFLDYYLSFDWTETGDYTIAEVWVPVVQAIK